jgi:hypothetical protein
MLNSKRVTIFPEDDEEFVAFLESRLVGTHLPELVDELTERSSLREVLGGSRAVKAMLTVGLRVLPIAALREHLLRHPRSLYTLQRWVFTRGGPYWDHVGHDREAVDSFEHAHAAPSANGTTHLDRDHGLFAFACSSDAHGDRVEDAPLLKPHAGAEPRRRTSRARLAGRLARAGVAATLLLALVGAVGLYILKIKASSLQGVGAALQRSAFASIRIGNPLSQGDWLPASSYICTESTCTTSSNENPAKVFEARRDGDLPIPEDYNTTVIRAAMEAENAIGISRNAKLEHVSYETAILWSYNIFRICSSNKFSDYTSNQEFRSRIELIRNFYGDRAETSYLEGRFDLAAGEVMLVRLKWEPASRLFKAAADRSLQALNLDQSYLKAKNNYAWCLYRLAEIESERRNLKLAREYAASASRTALEALTLVAKNPIPERMTTFAEYVDTFQKVTTWRARSDDDVGAREQVRREIADAFRCLRPLRLEDPEWRSQVVVAEAVPKLLGAVELLGRAMGLLGTDVAARTNP